MGRHGVGLHQRWRYSLRRVNREDDNATIEAQIGRPQRAESTVVSRCHLGLPVVVQVPPVLDDGTPFPTLFWLTCPLAISRIGRLEGTGGVKRMEAKAEADEEFGRRLALAHAEYEEERSALLPEGPGPAAESVWPAPAPGGSMSPARSTHGAAVVPRLISAA